MSFYSIFKKASFLTVYVIFILNNEAYSFRIPQICKYSSVKLCATENNWISTQDKVKNLRDMLENDSLTIMPCCYDGLTARLVEQAGFDLTFMTGFGVSATYGLPDTGRYA
jgi:hypothetical protein